jgi:hypothetical protein
MYYFISKRSIREKINPKEKDTGYGVEFGHSGYGVGVDDASVIVVQVLCCYCFVAFACFVFLWLLL